jgi:hypothetical protein
VKILVLFPKFHLVRDPGMSSHESHTGIQPVPMLEVRPYKTEKNFIFGIVYFIPVNGYR